MCMCGGGLSLTNGYFKAASHVRRENRPSPVSFTRPPLRLSHLLKTPPFNTITHPGRRFQNKSQDGGHMQSICIALFNFPVCSLTGLPFAQAQLIPALISLYYLLPVLKSTPSPPDASLVGS